MDKIDIKLCTIKLHLKSTFKILTLKSLIIDTPFKNLKGTLKLHMCLFNKNLKLEA